MTTAFLDSSVVLSATNRDEPLHEWALGMIQKCQEDGAGFICDIVYCELSMGLGSKLSTDRVIDSFSLQRVPNQDDALVRAGEAYKAYKKANKNAEKDGVLPDFFVASHAAVAQLPLITRDKRKFATWLPELQIIKP